jgi:hypothetical protein
VGVTVCLCGASRGVGWHAGCLAFGLCGGRGFVWGEGGQGRVSARGIGG